MFSILRRVKGSKKYLKPDQVDFSTEKPTEVGTGSPVVAEWEKMSKSKHNGVDPNLILDKYGCDTTRAMMLCDVGPASDRNWTENSWERIRNIQIRLLKLVSMSITLQEQDLPKPDPKQIKQGKDQLWDARNYYLKVLRAVASFTFTTFICDCFLENKW